MGRMNRTVLCLAVFLLAAGGSVILLWRSQIIPSHRTSLASSQFMAETAAYERRHRQLTRLLTDADLCDLSAGDLRFLRNAVFARRGMRFKSPDLSEHFSRFAWYTPLHDDIRALLSETDRHNVSLIAAYEQSLSLDAGNAPLTAAEEQLAGSWQAGKYPPDQGFERYEFKPDRTFEFRNPDGFDDRGTDGHWRVAGNRLLLTVTRIVAIVGTRKEPCPICGELEYVDGREVSTELETPKRQNLPLTGVETEAEEYGNWEEARIWEKVTIGDLVFWR